MGALYRLAANTFGIGALRGSKPERAFHIFVLIPLCFQCFTAFHGALLTERCSRALSHIHFSSVSSFNPTEILGYYYLSILGCISLQCNALLLCGVRLVFLGKILVVTSKSKVFGKQNSLCM